MRKPRVLLSSLFLCLPGFLLASLSARAQTTAPNEWTWMGGLSTGGEAAVYGTLGTPAPGNIPLPRYQATTWTDRNSNLWLFGGDAGFQTDSIEDLELNDLWEFNPSTNEWAWMAGSSVARQPGIYGTLGTPSAKNTPGGREDSSSWTDSKGNLWLFGGYGSDASGTVGILNDLWEFNPSTGEWTWMSGNSTIGSSCFGYNFGEAACAQSSVYGTLGTPAAGNTPGSREGATTWIDGKGNLWLFGGWSYDVSAQVQYYFDELWEYTPSTNQWAWMGGSSTRDGSACFWNLNYYYYTCGEPGVYGTTGTPAAGNIPGGRAGATKWTDSQGNLWLFSGSGFDANGSFGDPNDLWKFNPSTNQWTWMGGNNAIPPCSDYDCSAPAVYGTLGTPAPGNIPRGRDHAIGWTESNGNLWLFGGGGGEVPDNVTNQGLNDLWEFNPSTNQWALMGGTIQTVFANSQAVYGVLGIPAPGNGPGARFAPAGWTDGDGSFWLFGGLPPIAEDKALFDNDLWKYQPSNDPLPTAATPTFSVPEGTYTGNQTVTISDATNGATIYYTLDGSTPTTSSPVFYPNSPISIPYSETLQAIAVASGCLESAIATATYTLPPQAATPTFSLPVGTYTSFQIVTIADATAGATIYYTTNGVTPTTSSSAYSGPITVTGSEMVEAFAAASGHSNSFVARAMYTLNLPQVAIPTFSVPTGTYNTPQTVTISDATPGATIYYQIGMYPTVGNSPVYSGPITVSSSETIWAIATANNYYQSYITGATYNINPNSPQVATPTFNVPGGMYTTPQTVTISDATPGATIFYTTNGTTPTTGSMVYGGPITIGNSETLQAIGVVNTDVNSGIASTAYTINLPVAATPTLNLPSGTYTTPQTVTISDATSGATIFYTTDGTTPTTSSVLYTGPVTIANSETLQAIAAGSVYANSGTASATYTINSLQDFSVSSSTASLSINAGQSETVTILVTPFNGFSSAVSFACSGLPSGTSCSFSPATLTPSGTMASTTLTVTAASTATAASRHGYNSLFPGSVLTVAFCFLSWKKQRRLRMMVLLALSFLSIGLLNGCGDKSSSERSSAYSTVNVTATAGSLQHTTALLLTVN